MRFLCLNNTAFNFIFVLYFFLESTEFSFQFFITDWRNLDWHVINQHTNIKFGYMSDARIYLLAFLAIATYCGNYGFNFWLPTMIKDSGVWSNKSSSTCESLTLFVVNWTARICRVLAFTPLATIFRLMLLMFPFSLTLKTSSRWNRRVDEVHHCFFDN